MNARNLVLLTLLMISACARLGFVKGQADSSAIRALLQAYEAAINRRDVDAAIATYLPDADVWVVGYDRIVGLEAIRQNEERAVGAPGFQAWTTSVEAIRFIGADAAVVESSGAVTIGGDRIGERITWVVNRTVAGWRIAAVRIMAFERSGSKPDRIGLLCQLLLGTVMSANTQLQRAVIRHRVRAAGAALPLCARGAHDTLARGR